MTNSVRGHHPPSGTRRYLVHLSCAAEESSGEIRYIMRLRPWIARRSARCPQTQERCFDDEYELMQAVNPLLPAGSDVRNVLSLIESPEGFLYLLHLNAEQAVALGWRE